jgi:hypothetical protein
MADKPRPGTEVSAACRGPCRLREPVTPHRVIQSVRSGWLSLTCNICGTTQSLRLPT